MAEGVSEVSQSRRIRVSAGNIRQGHFYLTELQDWIPDECVGSSKESDGLGQLIRLDFEGLSEPVYSDVPSSPDGTGRRNFFRRRSEVRRFYEANGVRPEGVLEIERVDARHWRITVLEPGSVDGHVSVQGAAAEPVAIDAPTSGVVLPPVANIELLLSRLKQIEGLPERNMEDAVKEFFVLLGHPPARIKFQVGRIDLLLEDAEERPWAVVEVKKSLRSKSVRNQALRQGFDYAGQTGARLVIITDADEYRIYDRDQGRDYDSQFVGSFRLSAFRQEDETVLDLLKRQGPR